MPFSNPIVGGQGTLIRNAIQSPDYVAGVSGWAIKKDGSAEFNDATVRGVFVTGAAGGTTTYVEITDSVTGSEIRIWNPDGTDSSVISAPLAGATGTTPTLQLQSGLDRLGILVPDGTGRVQVSPELINLTFEVESSGNPIGGNVLLSPDTGVVVGAYRTAGDGVADGGEFRVTPDGFSLTADVNSVDFDNIEGTTAGIGFHGRMVSNISASPNVLAGTGWSLTEERCKQWGPMVFVHVMLTRTGAAIAAGDIADVSIATVLEGPPLSQTSCAAQWFRGTAAVSLDSAGDMLLRWLSTALQTGDALRIDTAYWAAPPS